MVVVLPLLVGATFFLQPPGVFHGDEVGARAGESWLALQVSGDSAALVPTPLILRQFEDLFVDAPGERAGVEVTSTDPGGVVVYLRSEALERGPVELAQVDAPDALAPPYPYRITFRGLSYLIESVCDLSPAGHVDGQAHYRCKLVLRGPQGSHLLASRVGYYEVHSDVMSWSDDGAQKLLFAGDLDRDGRLDLIFDTSDHYNKSRPALFMSTSDSGGFIHEVAFHESYGC